MMGLGVDCNCSFIDRWALWRENLTLEELLLAGIICWANWNDRNQRNNGIDVADVHTESDWITNYAMELLTRRRKTNEAQKNLPCLAIWKPPSKGTVKLNVDAAFDVRNQRGGVGVLVRDDRNSILAALISSHNVNSPLLAEICAIREAVRLAERCIHVGREGNKPAHFLAGEALHQNHLVLWLSDFSS
ncbi:uncharacterized protein LOC111012047 [Momordica charantia]|uniref:Uncharacterized protein LOC111012047 n=1 Tax=Momordica charantia TaxID=3673 RepID=A0A6J1CK80_MOMCH|nr:uncharacterized protein LOC111012047 [Momordica charantia]